MFSLNNYIGNTAMQRQVTGMKANQMHATFWLENLMVINVSYNTTADIENET
jgi:hypothetical protein